MNHIKSFFVSAYLSALGGALLWAALSLLRSPSSLGHWGVVLASGVPLLFFARLFLAPVARTSRHMPWLPLASAVGTVLSLVGGGAVITAVVAAISGLLTLAYIHWYSRFGPRDPAGLAVGQQMPDVTLHDLAGQPQNTQALTRQTALWLFYRGNWCPLCMAQIREVAADYRRLQARGVEVYLISPQPQDHSRSLAERFEAPMRFLRDTDNRTAARLGILAKGGLPMGMQALGYDSDVPMPTVFITAPGGRIVYSDLTDNYRVRPEPAEFIQALEAAGL
ncbi:MAG: peroxiredoxin-like family protein [Aquabacterium commune]|uniref:peroxiredoxin-like family protein n=1 Tax=Aquabacterium TaxID=92793 RepID=UPI001D236531|nr:peroxiredoxin-like family protein [Aquabacterium sp.]MBT9610473.1 AhpC/TSA family protein [Aquabacterium sp.]